MLPEGDSCMKALGIVGSYRTGGINDTVVEKILEGAAGRGAETEKIFLADKKIDFCRNCRQCTQSPGNEPGRCGLEDDMQELIRKCLASDLLILGSPVNFGSMTAVSKAFLERLVCLAYWPWGKPAPKMRHFSGRRMAVLVTSSVGPSFLSRFGAYHSLADLGKIAEVMHAEVVARLHYGLVAVQQENGLRGGQKRAAVRLGSCLVDRFHGNLGSRVRLRAVRRLAQSDLPQLPLVGPVFDRLASIPFRNAD
jgi:NAD(P)H-dependent FMN reductase